jgi:hypothetical protein
LRNGTYKYTYSHRLDNLNALVKELLPGARPLRVMDVAVSSGISTLEWAQDLTRADIEHEMVAGDLSVNALMISVGEHLHVLADGTGYPLQYDVFGKVIPSPPWRRHRALYFYPLWLLKRALAACFKASDKVVDQRASQTPRCRRISLVSPRLQQHAGLKVVEDDIFSDAPPPPGGFHVLRAANILNKSYFDDQMLMGISVNLRRRLTPGGLFIVCSTDPAGMNHGTVFTLTEGGSFESVARIGDGSEIESLILALPPREKGEEQGERALNPVVISRGQRECEPSC